MGAFALESNVLASKVGQGKFERDRFQKSCPVFERHLVGVTSSASPACSALLKSPESSTKSPGSRAGWQKAVRKKHRCLPHQSNNKTTVAGRRRECELFRLPSEELNDLLLLELVCLATENPHDARDGCGPPPACLLLTVSGGWESVGMASGTSLKNCACEALQ